MPEYNVTTRWLNPATHQFEPVSVRGLWTSGAVKTLTYRDVFYVGGIDEDPPIIVSVFMSSASNATIEWQDSYNPGTVLNYHIKRNGTDISGALLSTRQSFTDTAAPTGSPNPIINYTIYATTSSGITADSAAFPIQWQNPVQPHPPFPPTNFRVNLASVTETTADVAWDVSSDPSITGFRIFHGSSQLGADLPSTARSVTLVNLDPATAYNNMSVRAFNPVGQSYSSNRINFATDDPQGYVKRFPGHLAGLIYLGVYSANAYGTEDTAIQTDVALDRIIDSGVTGTPTQHVIGYQNKIDLASTDGKMPWISILPTHLGLAGSTNQANWNLISTGQADLVLEQYFDLIAEMTGGFCMLTFHPNPPFTAVADADAFCNATDYIGSLWANYNSKENGIFGPIISSEYYQAVQAAQVAPSLYINDQLLDSCEFLGVDLYQDNKNPPNSFASTRLNYIVSQYQSLTAHDNVMIAVGELAGANVFRNGGTYKGATIPANSLAPTGSQWLQEALTYIFGDRGRYFAVSAFDTSGLTTSPRWALDEASVTTGAGTLDSQTKMVVYRGYINGSSIARQQGDTVKQTLSCTANLDKASYQAGDVMTLTVTETAHSSRTMTITDSVSPAVTWTKQSDNGVTAIWTAAAPGTASTGRTVTVRVTRTFDNRTATATAIYAVTVTPPPPPPSGGMIMGISPAHEEGNVDWDAYRVYQRPEMMQHANRTGVARPLSLAYSDDGAPLGSSNNSGYTASKTYAGIKAYCLDELNSFYYGNAAGSVGSGTASTRSIRWGIKLYWMNGNENMDKGLISVSSGAPANPHTPTQITDYTNSMHALYDACHTIDSSTGLRRFPDAYAGSNPTHFQEQQGWCADVLTPTAQYHDCLIWSMYPPGRSPKGGSPNDPIYNWPSLQESDRTSNNLGFLIRCFYRTRQVLNAARTATGDPTRQMVIGSGEVATGKAGPSSQNDPVARNYYAVYGLAGAMQTLATQYQLVQGPYCWWDQDIGGGNDLILDDWSTANPHTVASWQNWRSYHTGYGGSKPASWAARTEAQKDAWAHTGNRTALGG